MIEIAAVELYILAWEKQHRYQSNIKMTKLRACLIAGVLSAIVLQLISTTEGCANIKGAHNYIFGNKSYYDRMLYHDYIKLKSNFMRVQSVDRMFPPNGTQPLGTISYIEVLDQRSDGTGGCAYIQNGGVGNNFVTLHIKTQRNHGMEFLINVYGRK